MKSYIATAAAIFGLIAVLHILRMFRERAASAEFLILTVLAACLAVWGFWLLRGPNGT